MKIDLEKFICGIIEAFPAFKEEGRVPCMYKEALAKQGLEYKDGAIVEIEPKHVSKFKVGDICVCGKYQSPFIFKGFLDKFHPECPVAYCGICEDGTFEICTVDAWWTDEECSPATLEQRIELEKAIADAGYKWDVEKRELIKNDEV